MFISYSLCKLCVIFIKYIKVRTLNNSLTKVESPEFGAGPFEVLVSSVNVHGVLEDSGRVTAASLGRLNAFGGAILAPLALLEKDIRQVSFLIHSASHTIPPVAITILTWNLCCFARFWKVGDGRTDTTCENSDHYRPWSMVGRVDQ